ncbi:MAG: FISUMP domain-containing protein [Bacteroidota bacterium]
MTYNRFIPKLLLTITVLIISVLSCSKDEPEPLLTGIQILNEPDKTNYFEGEVLDLTGLLITLSYDNGNQEDIGPSEFDANGISCTPAEGTDMAAGMEEVTISDNATGEYVTLELMYMKVTDIDENVYDVVKIGDQLWMAENLKVTKYPDGSAIPHITGDYEWNNLYYTDYYDAYCYVHNNAAGTEADTYGALYTWSAAMGGSGDNTSSFNPSGIQGVCPDGWHLPSDAEWSELNQYLRDNGFYDSESTALKSTEGWVNDGNGTDNFGFTALPAGARFEDGSFSSQGYSAYFWTTADKHDEVSRSWTYGLSYDMDILGKGGVEKTTGLSVRCVKN